VLPAEEEELAAADEEPTLDENPPKDKKAEE
jgi:hypothetical protein